MNAAALATPLPQALAALPAAKAAANAAAPVAGMTLTAANCVALTATLLRAACQRGQLEDASAAARIALALAAPHSPHQAMLRALADARPALMAAPDEHRLYLLRRTDGSALGLVRLRDNGQVAQASGPDATRWSLQDGNLDLCDDQGRAHTRFALCGEQPAPLTSPPGQPATTKRLYLGAALADGAPRLLQELNCTYSRLRMMDAELAGSFCSLYDIDAMVPAELPMRAVLLLAAPHCGGPALRATLNRSAAMQIDGELLHPRFIGMDDAVLPHHPSTSTPTPGGTLYDVRDKDPAWFARMMLARSHDPAGRDLQTLPVRGFTLAPMHSRQALDWAINEPALRIVHLVRSNLLAEYADILADEPSAPALLHFEAARFLRFVDMKQRTLAAMRARLVQRNADTVEVDASRLNAATLADLQAFLTDQPVAAWAADITTESGQPPVTQRFDNPAAVSACLATLDQAHWAAAEETPAAG